ncbi:N-acetylmuramoyl-L-alanine amidase [Roseospira marina]|uniref:N-acetylmuramoyl-L-alanine amidase n=1 Tax=Roseospira marina TaxID=140057 RepID=UPI0014791017|nr:N-acetylmuramoyl-L-alanine amidase [Roseospira marina]MBB4316051.1 hypothetical protein [Roseospira marina]MBB5089231.1 hypothetical protein [Roseospira marina]
MPTVAPSHYRPPGREVRRVFLHCSASDADTSDYEGDHLVRTVRTWHVQRGWSDVGYHYLIDRAGRIMPGRDLERIPAAQKGHNTGSVAIMVHGLTQFSDASLAACRSLCVAINAAHGGRVTFHGHCEVSAKSCPVFDYRSLLGLDSAGRMPLHPDVENAPPAPLPPPPKPRLPAAGDDLRKIAEVIDEEAWSPEALAIPIDTPLGRSLNTRRNLSMVRARDIAAL